jgi:hypothetical protein
MQAVPAMTRPKMVLVPETAVRDLKTLPVTTCDTCRWRTLDGVVSYCDGPVSGYFRIPHPERFFCCDWTPHE